MKLVTYLQGDRQDPADLRVGAVIGERVRDLSAIVSELALDARATLALRERGVAPRAASMLKLLMAGDAGMERVRAALGAAGPDTASGKSVPDVALAAVTLLAPVPHPGKVVAIGRNYGEHAQESGSGGFEQPRVIAKLPSAVCGPGTAVAIPPAVTKPDFEVELGVVIGSFARDVPRAQALSHVAGYTVLNDISAREFQFDVSPPQTTFAKSFDQSCPMGPWIVTRDEIADPQRLDIACRINGETLQQANTAEMLFPVDVLIEYVTRYMTLEPGDVIATGTPAGVGAFRKPPRWLVSGDSLELSVEGVGTLVHTIA
jgi:2-keto-4-pentenoate hydratase/2-oxohepta-3-ene-1,7-dioic acid hydratase in catechol pathway